MVRPEVEVVRYTWGAVPSAALQRDAEPVHLLPEQQERPQPAWQREEPLVPQPELLVQEQPPGSAPQELPQLASPPRAQPQVP